MTGHFDKKVQTVKQPADERQRLAICGDGVLVAQCRQQSAVPGRNVVAKYRLDPVACFFRQSNIMMHVIVRREVIAGDDPFEMSRLHVEWNRTVIPAVLRTQRPLIATVEVVFSERDRTLIHEYYRRRHLPPGLAKRSSLPPGLQKQVQRRGQLPPGLRGKGLPDELEVKLSRLPKGYVRLRVGVDFVLMNTRTRVIVDVIKDM